MPARAGGLWRERAFRAFWAGRTVSALGSQVTLLALPLVAVLALGATPLQMGLLTAAGSLPALLCGLVVGVWVDRRRRRPLMIVADLGRGALLLAIPVAALLGVLRVETLYAVAFLAGGLTLVFDVAAQSFFPTLVGRDRLVAGNSALEVSRSGAEILGPGLAGGLVQLVTAPFAVVADAASFLASALLLGLIRAPEPVPEPPDARQRLWPAIGEGLRAVLGHPVLRALAGAAGLLACFNSVLEAVFLLYLSRDLGLAPALLGLIFAGGSVGFLVGAAVAGPVAARLGQGPTLIAAIALVGLSDFLIPLAGGVRAFAAPLLVAAQFLFGLGLTGYNIAAVSLRQGSTPDRLQGRVNASVRFLVQGLTPLGALAGGVLGLWLGLRPTLVLAAAGELLAALWLLASPLRAGEPIPPRPEGASLSQLWEKGDST